MELHEKSLSALSRDLQSKAISSEELTRHYIDRIKKYDAKLNSFITLAESHAIQQARAADERIAAGKAGAVTGIPIAQKDIFCTKGVKTSCGSKMLDNFVSPYDATVVENFNNAGAVMIGKLNMDEFAMGSSNETSYYGAVANPWDDGRVPGGSSGGSASAVAARLVPGATGTDTGGSIRQPASLCGITGLKPTYGRVSRYGMIAFASSLDQAGPLCQSAEDAALMLNAMASFDPKDSTSVNKAVPDYSESLNDDLKGLKVGIIKEHFGAGLQAGVGDAVQAAIDQLKQLGAEVQEVSLPNSDLAVPAYYVVAPAEASSNLSRFDGARYGYRCDSPKDLEDMYKRSRGEGFGPEVKRRIMVGTYALSAGYYDAYYLKAQKVRRLISDDYKKAFEKVDVIVGPTSPSVAFKMGERTSDPITMYLSDIYTIATNLAGLPGMSIPAGFSENLPVGLQIVGNYFKEARLLNIAHRFQQQTDWHTQMPKGFE